MAQEAEPRDIREKRLKIRSWRRGMKEMDLMLGRFADEAMSALSETELDAYEALIAEADNDLHRWFTKRGTAPAHHQSMIDRIQKNFQ